MVPSAAQFVSVCVPPIPKADGAADVELPVFLAENFIDAGGARNRLKTILARCIFRIRR
jgi:hypothetical protein